MSSRYVELPNGSYLEWPEGVSADTFKAKATKLMGSAAPTSTPNRVNESMGKVSGISAYHPQTGLAGVEEKLGNWRQQLSEFANRGAGSYKVGNTSEIGDLMASGPMGALKTAKGVSEVPQGKLWKGAKDVVGGGMEAMTIPSMMFAPEGAGAAKNMLPSTEKAGKLLEAVEQSAGHVPIDVNGPGNAAMKFYENVQSGGSPSQIINKFLQRVTKTDAPPLTFKEARRFYENATRLSFDATKRLNPKAKYLLTKFTKELDQSLQGAASEVGQLQNYGKGMQAYRTATRFRDVKSKTGKLVEHAVLPAGGAYGLYELLKASGR